MQADSTSRILDAASRYEDRVDQRKSVRGSNPRKNYLARSLARAKAEMLSSEATASGLPSSTSLAVSRFSQERIIGSSDLLDINYLELAIAVGRGVARIKIGNAFGTGFLVGQNLIMTNHHVLEDENDARMAVAQFDYQDNASGELLPRHDYRLDPTSFFLTNAVLDFTIVGVERQSNRGRLLSCYPWLKLIGELGKGETGDSINIIQHPRGGLKQIALRKNEIIEIPNGIADFLYYTTDTEPGSSGSPCFNDQWEIVALHHSGVPAQDSAKQILRTDGQVWRKGFDAEGLIQWIGNEGARTSAIVSALRTTKLKSELQDRIEQMLQSSPPNPIQLARAEAANGPAEENQRSVHVPNVINAADAVVKESGNCGQALTWTIPLHVTVTLGAPAPGFSPQQLIREDNRQLEDLGIEVSIDPNWETRNGYNPNFLGQEIRLPELSDRMKENTVDVPAEYRRNDDKYTLNYFHYSVAMNKKRRCAWFSAAMIEGTQIKDFKRGKDKWFLDPRIDSKFQMGEELYAAAQTDRGHLTRFKDLSWGADLEEAVKSTNDSFHFTNAALQLAGFNQGKERWQGLELFLLEQHAKKDERKMIVFTGPVLLDSDPIYQNEFMNYRARIPLAFWKICCLRRQDGSLSATGFKLSQQDISELPGFEERFDVFAAQVTIAELENLTGLKFGVLTRYDHFAKGGTSGTLEREWPEGNRKINPISDFMDIKL